jgi:hypothetical protein
MIGIKCALAIIASCLYFLGAANAQEAELTLVCTGVTEGGSMQTDSTHIFDIDFGRSVLRRNNGTREWPITIDKHKISSCVRASSTSRSCIDINRITAKVTMTAEKNDGFLIYKFSGTCKKSEGKKF